MWILVAHGLYGHQPWRHHNWLRNNRCGVAHGILHKHLEYLNWAFWNYFLTINCIQTTFHGTHFHIIILYTYFMCQYEAPIVWSFDTLCQVTVKCVLKNPQDICSKIFLASFFYNDLCYGQLVHRFHFTLFKYLIFLSSLYIHVH